MPFGTEKVVISLDPNDLAHLQKILMDGDEDAALAFLREVISPRVLIGQDDSHRPPFEGGLRIERTPGFFKKS